MHERGQALLSISFDHIDNAEYQEAYKTIARTQRQKVTVLFTGLLLSLFILFYWLANRDLVAAEIWIALLLLTSGSVRWLRSRQLKAAAQRGNKDMPVRITFMENGTLGETRHSDNFRRWEGFEGYVETPATITLVPTYRYYSVIPKRALEQGSLAQLQLLLHRKLKNLSH